MAQVAKKLDQGPALDPRIIDPVNPMPRPVDSAEFAEDPRYQPANDAKAEEWIANETRGVGTGVYVAVIALIIAAAAYFFWAPASDAPAPAEPAATAPTQPAPADPTVPPPRATAPTETAPAPVAPAN